MRQAANANISLLLLQQRYSNPHNCKEISPEFSRSYFWRWRDAFRTFDWKGSLDALKKNRIFSIAFHFLTIV